MKTLSLCAVVASITLTWAQSGRAQDVLVDPQGVNNGGLTNALKFGSQEPQGRICAMTPLHRPCPDVATQEGILSTRVAPPLKFGERPFPPANPFGLDLLTDAQPRLSITHGGLVGIGTQKPQHILDLRHDGDVEIGLQSNDAGNRQWTLQSSGLVDPSRVGLFQIVDRTAQLARLMIDANGVVSVNTLQILGGADLAEPFKTDATLPRGSVVRIDSEVAGRLVLSDRAYDRRVAGIVSGANDVKPGVTLEQMAGADTQQVALSGRVYAIADTSGGPIRPGDLLTSSATPGHAMKVSNFKRAEGAVIGKAMSTLDHGTGFVMVLVSLQ